MIIMMKKSTKLSFREVAIIFSILAFVPTVFSLVPPCPNKNNLKPGHLNFNHQVERNAALMLLPSSVIQSASSLTLAEESWRQYVAFALIAGVLVDIVLGSPLANIALKPLKGDEGDGNVASEDEKQDKFALNRSKERIDTEQYAQDAIDRAQSTLELRKFLDESKTDWDKMEEMKRKLDSEMLDLDEDLAAREESLRKRKE